MAADIEQTLDALVAKLQAELPAKVATINSAVTDGHVIAAPNQNAYSVGARGEIYDYPHVMALPGPSLPSIDNGSRLIAAHVVRVIGWLSEADEEALARKMLRFQRAIREVCLRARIPSQNLGDVGGYSLKWLGDEPGRVFREDEESPFVQATRSSFEIAQQQDL